MEAAFLLHLLTFVVGEARSLSYVRHRGTGNGAGWIKAYDREDIFTRKPAWPLNTKPSAWLSCASGVVL
jgi:hypothetical protein